LGVWGHFAPINEIEEIGFTNNKELILQNFHLFDVMPVDFLQI
jgi:hypothetical protein